MQDSLIGRGSTVATTRMTRNSASLQSLQAAGHAAALADGLVGAEGVRSSGRPGAGTRSGASHSSSRGIKHEVVNQAVERGGSIAGEREATSAAAAVAATATSPADSMLGAMLGGGSGGVGGGGGGGQKKQKTPGLRRGKWTTEEEKYANRLIHEFKAGLLPLTDGTTLRTFLSIMLNCDPMRISKKFVGSNCIGKQVFRRQHGGESDPALSEEAMGKSWTELADLERNFLERVAENTSKLKHGGGGAAAASGYGRSQLSGHDAGDPPPTRASGAIPPPASASAEQAGRRSRSGSWRDDPEPSDNEAGGKQGDAKMVGQDLSGQRPGSSSTTPAPTTRQRKLRSRPQQPQQDQQRQQHHPQHPQNEARRDRLSQSSSRTRNRGGKGTAVETHRGVENEERPGREIGDPGDSASSSSRASLSVTTDASSVKTPGVGIGRKRGVAQEISSSVRGRKKKNSARRGGKGEGGGKEAAAGDKDGEREEGEGAGKTAAPAQQRRQQQKQRLEEEQQQREQRERQEHEQQQGLEQQQQELSRQQQQQSLQLQLQQQVLMQQQQQAFVQQHAQQQQQQQQQQQVAIGNPAFGFDNDGGPVPRAQPLNAFPSNASLSGSLSVQNLAMLLGMSGGGAGLESGGGSGGGVAGGGGGGVVSSNFQAAADFAGVAGAMRSTPSSLFVRSSFGQLTDLQVENMNLIHVHQHQQQQLHLPQHSQQNMAGADCGPGGVDVVSGSGVAMTGCSNGMGGANAMQVVVPHFFMGGRRTSAEDFLSLLQDSEELQAREAQQVREESEERSQSPITGAAGSPRLSSSLSSGHGLAPQSPPAATGPLGRQLGKPGVMGRGASGGDVTDLSPHSARSAADASTSGGGGVDGVAGVCIRDDGADGRGKAGLSSFANGGVGGTRGVGRGILLGIVPGTREEAIVDDDNNCSEDMYLVGETAEREEDEEEEDRVTAVGDIAGPLSNGLRAGMGGGHLELKMGEIGRSMDQEAR